MTTGVKPIQLAVKHVGQPGKGMPVGGVFIRKRPEDSLCRQAAGNLGIFPDVSPVVENDEVMMNRLAEDDPDRGEEEQTNPDRDRAFADGRTRHTGGDFLSDSAAHLVRAERG